MSFNQNLTLLQQQVQRFKHQVPNKEAAKLAFVIPFLECLGYDVRDPYEVKPGFSLGIDSESANRVDFCVMVNNAPAFLLACENPNLPLVLSHSPLPESFATFPCKFAILTDGIEYQFFSDLEEDGQLDPLPFFSLNLENFTDTQVEDLSQFRKPVFNTKEILVAVTTLKFRRDLKEALYQELVNPSEEFIFHILKSIKIGRVTQKLIEAYRPDVKECIRETLEELVDDMISPTSSSAMSVVPVTPGDSPVPDFSSESRQNGASELIPSSPKVEPKHHSTSHTNGHSNGIFESPDDDAFPLTQ